MAWGHAHNEVKDEKRSFFKLIVIFTTIFV